ncbi:ADP-ribosylation factor-like protein 14 [Esox lucius]|uniref:ADP-ribosylation factor-like protein 14 n=1 Tax=Esox lucius TaxID=8010 RepID=A0A3P8ZAC4_ESOLU|nr:ADP-ribosylation factor-like protein 14 [Esox lucius]
MTCGILLQQGEVFAACPVYRSHSDLNPARAWKQKKLTEQSSHSVRAGHCCREAAKTTAQASLLLQTTGPVFRQSMGLHGSKHPQQAQIVMLGLDGSGKSTLLYKLKYNECVITVPTVGFNVEMLETEARGPGLTVWDVGGQQRMRPYWKHHYQGTGAVVFVVDSWDRRRLEEARKELHTVLKNVSLKRVPLVILANKQDLPGAANPQEVIHRLDLRRVCENRDWFVQPCCGRTGVGLEEGFRMVAYLLKISLKQTEVDIKNTVKQLKPKAILMMTKRQGLGQS